MTIELFLIKSSDTIIKIDDKGCQYNFYLRLWVKSLAENGAKNICQRRQVNLDSFASLTNVNFGLL